MGILTRDKILSSISKGLIAFDPIIDIFQVQPIAIDIRVGNNFFLPKLTNIDQVGRVSLSNDHLDDSKKNEVLDQIHLESGQVFELLPGEFALISSREKLTLSSKLIMAKLFSRSSTNRRGILIESGIIEPFFSGHLTIPVLNQTTTQVIKIYPGERIAQIVFEKLDSPIAKQDALDHGGVGPKYQENKAYNLDYKFDPHDEIEIIRNGRLDELKKYSINIEKLDNERRGQSERF